MGPLDHDMARRRGQRKLDAMKRRAGQLRRRVIVTAIIGFVLLWTVVFVQLATGNDPALGTGPVAKKHAAIERKRRKLEASIPPPREEVEEVPSTTEIEADEGAAIEAEQAEIEARELEELETVTTGQS
jgi:hypothetical protein